MVTDADLLDRDTDDADDSDALTSDNLAEVRAYAKRMEKRARAAEKQAKSFEVRLGEIENRDRTSSFDAAAAEVGLTDEQKALLLNLKPDADGEAVKAFAGIFGSPQGAEEEGEGQAAVREAPAATLQSRSGWTPTTGGSGLPPADVTSDAIKEAIRRRDSAAVAALVAQAAKDPSRLNLKHGHLIPE